MKSAKRWLTGLLVAGTAAAFGGPHIGYLYPAGGRAGTTVEVLVGGRALWSINQARISGTGIKVVGVERVPGMGHIPVTQKRYLTKYLKQLRQGNTEEPPRTGETKEWRKHRYYDNLGTLTPLQRELVERNVYLPRDPLQNSPSLAEMAIVKLEIAKDAPPGRREFRLTGRGQISDPLPFYVDTVPEVNEPRYTPPDVPHPRAAFPIPAVLNGQILPGGESDLFDFHARKGEVLTFSVRARALVPFMGDGVPGHFQAVLEVLNANGRLIAAADDHHFDPDPVLTFRAPENGRYTLRIRDALYRGRQDFVYRIRARRGRAKFAMPEPEAPADGAWIDAPAAGTELKLPAYLRFKLERPGAKLYWKFPVRPGDKLNVQVIARRLGSPLDARLTIIDPAGEVAAEVDDVKCPRVGTILHQADPACVVPESVGDGVCTLEVADASGTGGPEAFGYLKVAPAAPDFTLYATPSGVSAAPDNPAVVKVTAVRSGGFDGRIVLATPPDSELRIVGANSLEPGMDHGAFTFAAQSWRRVDNVARRLRIIGFAGELRREARPADEAMQAFAYTHLVPAEELLAMQTWGSAHSRRFQWVDPDAVITLVPGGKATLRMWRRHTADAAETYSLAAAPKGVVITESKESDGMVEHTIQAADDTPIGAANLILRVNCKYTNDKGKRATDRITLPAVRLRVLKCPER